MKIKPSNFSSTEHDYFSMATLCVFFTCASNFVFVFLRFTTCHRVQKKSKILLFSFLLCRFVTRLVHDKFTVHSKATYYTFWLLSPVLFPFALVYIQQTVRRSSGFFWFFCTREQVSVFAFTLWSYLLKAFDTHRNSSPTYPTTTASSVACSVADIDRQTDRQELRGQDQKSTLSGAWRLWSDTAIRSEALAPPARLERRGLKILSVWETGPSMSKPFIALASYCFSLLGG